MQRTHMKEGSRGSGANRRRRHSEELDLDKASVGGGTLQSATFVAETDPEEEACERPSSRPA